MHHMTSWHVCCLYGCFKLHGHVWDETQRMPGSATCAHHPEVRACCLQVEIGNMDISLKYFEEVYTTEHWMVRVYRVLDKCALPRGTTDPCGIKCKSPHGSATCRPTNSAHAHVYNSNDALLLVLGAPWAVKLPGALQCRM